MCIRMSFAVLFGATGDGLFGAFRGIHVLFESPKRRMPGRFGPGIPASFN
jgi:hypothetical protein